MISDVNASRMKVGLLLAAGLAHTLATFFLVVPAYLSVDEGICHWMVKSFHDTGGLALWNGYEEFPALTLVHPYIKAHNGHLYSPYPYLFAVLSYPWYHVAGFFGLFLLNSLCFAGTVTACFFATRRLFEDRVGVHRDQDSATESRWGRSQATDLALNACLILIFATFAWEYSQAAWAHSTATFFVLTSFCLFVYAYRAEQRAEACAFAVASGLVAGLAPGIRVDAILVLPGLVLPFLFARPWRPREAVLIVVGALPGLLVLSATNVVKFGVFSPLSYGEVAPEPIPAFQVLLAGLVLLIGAWAATRQTWGVTGHRESGNASESRWGRSGGGEGLPFQIHRAQSRLKPGERLPCADAFHQRRTTFLLLAAAGAVVALIFALPLRNFLVEILKGGHISLIDIRALDWEVPLAGAARSEGGGVISVGSHRKALLQSMPYLPILLVPLFDIFRARTRYSALVVLLLVPATVIAYHSYTFLKLQGAGLILNCRYFVVSLPFLAILSAYAIHELPRRWGEPFGIKGFSAISLLTAAVFVLLTTILGTDSARLEFPCLVMPLLMASLLLISVVAGEFAGLGRWRLVAKSSWVLLISALTWAGLSAFLYDYPTHRMWRGAHQFVSEQVLKVVPDDSLVFASPATHPPSVRLIEKDRVRIGLVQMDHLDDLSRLLEFHLKNGRRAFGFLSRDQWKRVTAALPGTVRITPVMVLNPSDESGAFVLSEVSLTKNP